MSIPLLTISNANKSYGGVPALINASLELLGGEVHALMGENGAGKSTLIKLLAGVIQADSAQIALRGKPVTIHTPQDAFRLGLRFVHQELNVVNPLSVAENVFLSQPYPTRAGIFVNWRKLERDARAALENLGITHIQPRELMARLRPGDQMLVKIVSAFVGSEQSDDFIYVMDEPTAALTGEEAAMLFRVIRSLQERGCAVLYVSHRMEEIFQIADRITVMRDGQMVATHRANETSSDELIRLMTGRRLEQVYPPRESAPGEALLLDVQNVCTEKIADATFQLHEGEILGVAGLNGAGRTELLRALVGADRLLSGEIQLGKSVQTRHSPVAAWGHGMAYVPEERRSQGLILAHSVSHNISLPHLRAFSWGGLLLNHRREHAAAHELGGQVQLKARLPHQRVRQLSGGNQQKVLFARALARSPRVLLLDEPTRGVDVGAKHDIYQLIRRISHTGTGIVMVSSELGELIGLCDRILIIREGRLAQIVYAEGQTEETLLALCYGEIRRNG